MSLYPLASHHRIRGALPAGSAVQLPGLRFAAPERKLGRWVRAPRLPAPQLPARGRSRANGRGLLPAAPSPGSDPPPPKSRQPSSVSASSGVGAPRIQCKFIPDIQTCALQPLVRSSPRGDAPLPTLWRDSSRVAPLELPTQVSALEPNHLPAPRRAPAVLPATSTHRLSARSGRAERSRAPGS